MSIFTTTVFNGTIFSIGDIVEHKGSCAIPRVAGFFKIVSLTQHDYGFAKPVVLATFEPVAGGRTRDWLLSDVRHDPHGNSRPSEMRLSMRECSDAYTQKNNQGMGYAPYTDTAGDDTVEAAVDAAVADGWTLHAHPTNSDEVAILVNEDEEVLAIGGDGMGRGAWAVDITQYLLGAT